MISKICLRLREIDMIAKMIFAWFVSKLYKKVDFWLISERGREARDNGFVFYKWIKQNHPEVFVKYIISKESKDFARINSEDIVLFKSFNHLVCIWRAKYLISTHIMGYTPDHVFFSKLDSKIRILRGKKKIFLQHGIIKDKLESLFYRNINVNLFVSGSNLEYKYISDNFGYPEGIVQYTGLCRYDNLVSIETKNQLLIMPTFRIYVDREHFEDSEYFIAYRDLLCSKEFHCLLEQYDYQAVFYPHYEFQSKISLFQKLDLSDRVLIADMSYDVQQLLKESNLLITDFSSVFFDMMYMNKPIVFYQFDEERYRIGHYKQGYLNYRDVGPVVKEIPDLLKAIEYSLSNNERIGPYQDYYNMTFTKRDTLNCQRVYDAIIRC